MIIRCTKLYNRNTKQYHNGPSMGSLTIGALYSVLEIYFNKDEIEYRIFADAPHYYSHPILVRSDDFEVVSGLLPNNWELYRFNKNQSGLGPKSWNIYEPWEESFWQDFDNNLPKARECFDKELKIIFDTEPEYIKIIDQQQGRESYFKK